MYAENALMIPRQVIPSLRTTRGPQWAELIERVSNLPETHEETLALMLLMIRLNGCMTCETDSYRAMRGCASCAQQTLRRHKGSDEELLEMFRKALADVRTFAAEESDMNILVTAQEHG